MSRTIMAIVVCFVCGLIVHIGLAVLLAWLQPMQQISGGRYTSRVFAEADRATGLTFVEIETRRFGQRWSWRMLGRHGFGVGGPGAAESIDILNIEASPTGTLETVVVPRRRSLESFAPERAELLRQGGGEPGVMVRWPLEHTSGWPVLALRCWNPALSFVWGATSYRSLDGNRSIDGGWQLPAPPNSFAPPHTIPYTPHWGGLIGGALFWGGLLWLSTFGSRELKRARRRSQNRCQRCGYELGHVTTCPECGSGVPTREPTEQAVPRHA